MTVGLAGTALLASCSGLGAAPGEVAPSASGSTAVAPSESSAPSASAAPESTAPLVVATPSTVVTTPGKAAVVPFVTSATWDSGRGVIDVSAIVPKILESGTCTAVAVQGDVTLQKSGDAAAASSYTGCSQLAIGGSELTSGTWSVTVSYASDESAGTSAARTVTVG